jgi:Putative MetA-pathway of phenol degradation
MPLPVGTLALQALVLAASAVVCTFARAADTESADHGLQAAPYRPTISNPADLPAERHLEWEAGGLSLHDRDGQSHQSVPYLLKYAFAPDFGVLVGGESGVSDRSGADSTSGWGDTSLALKFRHSVAQSTAIGLEVGVILPTASAGLGSGHTDFSMNGIISTELNDYDVDLNVSYTELGVADPGASRGIVGWAIAASHAIVKPWGFAAELSGVEQRGAPSATQFLAALTYALRPTVVLDCGSLFGLNRGAPRYGAFAGLTVLVP